MTTPIVLLHGANGSAQAVSPLAQALREQWPVVAIPNLLGHGGRPVPDRLSIAGMAEDLLEQLDENGITRAALVGYSLGGYLALYCARHHPQRVSAVCTLATRHVLDDAALARWVDITTRENLVRRSPNRRFELAQEHHPQDWQLVLARNRAMFEDMRRHGSPLSADDLLAIDVPALVISGVADQLVSKEESVRLGQLLRAPILMFDGPAHPLMAVPLEAVARGIGEWLGGPAFRLPAVDE